MIDVAPLSPRKPNAPQRPTSLWQLFFVFVRLGSMSFGGSVLSWLYREVVVRRRWIEESDYLTALSIGMILPGPNPVNMSVQIGRQIGGGPGALAAVGGLILPAFTLILLLGLGYAQIQAHLVSGFVLGGLAASGVGVSLATGIKLLKRLPHDLVTLATTSAVFVASAILRWHIVIILMIAVPATVLLRHLPGTRQV